MVHTISATVMNIRSHIKKHINAGASVVSTLPNPQDNYYYFLYAYNLYVREQLFCIWRECSCMINTKVHLLISDLEYQISSYAKTKILKYVIRYESTLIDKIITKKSQLSNDYILIYEFSNSEEWVSYLFDKYPILEEILDNYTTNLDTDKIIKLTGKVVGFDSVALNNFALQVSRLENKILAIMKEKLQVKES